MTDLAREMTGTWPEDNFEAEVGGSLDEPVELVASFDDALMADALALWKQWMAEEGREAKVEWWAYHLMSWAQSGFWFNEEKGIAVPYLIPIIAYVGGKPAGMVCVYFSADPFEGGMVGFADYAYVVPEFRNHSIFAELALAAYNLGVESGAVALGLPSRIGSFLEGFYDRLGGGFNKVAVVWRKRMEV